MDVVVGDTMTLLVGIGSSSERVKQSARDPDILLIQTGLVHRRCNLSESGDFDARVARFNNLRIGKSVNADVACAVPTETLIVHLSFYVRPLKEIILLRSPPTSIHELD